jgi:hypothetical protein
LSATTCAFLTPQPSVFHVFFACPPSCLLDDQRYFLAYAFIYLFSTMHIKPNMYSKRHCNVFLKTLYTLAGSSAPEAHAMSTAPRRQGMQSTGKKITRIEPPPKYLNFMINMYLCMYMCALNVIFPDKASFCDRHKSRNVERKNVAVSTWSLDSIKLYQLAFTVLQVQQRKLHSQQSFHIHISKQNLIFKVNFY